MGQGLWFIVCGLWFMVYSFWFIVYGLWFMVYGQWFMVYGSGLSANVRPRLVLTGFVTGVFEFTDLAGLHPPPRLMNSIRRKCTWAPLLNIVERKGEEPIARGVEGFSYHCDATRIRIQRSSSDRGIALPSPFCVCAHLSPPNKSLEMWNNRFLGSSFLTG